MGDEGLAQVPGQQGLVDDGTLHTDIALALAFASSEVLAVLAPSEGLLVLLVDEVLVDDAFAKVAPSEDVQVAPSEDAQLRSVELEWGSL